MCESVLKLRVTLTWSSRHRLWQKTGPFSYLQSMTIHWKHRKELGTWHQSHPTLHCLQCNSELEEPGLIYTVSDDSCLHTDTLLLLLFTSMLSRFNQIKSTLHKELQSWFLFSSCSVDVHKHMKSKGKSIVRNRLYVTPVFFATSCLQFFKTIKQKRFKTTIAHHCAYVVKSWGTSTI